MMNKLTWYGRPDQEPVSFETLDELRDMVRWWYGDSLGPEISQSDESRPVMLMGKAKEDGKQYVIGWMPEPVEGLPNWAGHDS